MEPKIKSNVIISDCDYEEVSDFKKALEERGESWKVKTFVCNGQRNLFSNIKRIFTYIFVGLNTFFTKKKYGKIICWQQFFGIFCAFFSRLFFSKEKNKIIIMTFIYKEKKGIKGKIYRKMINYALHSKIIEKITVSSTYEIEKYSSEFGIDSRKFDYLAWGQNPETELINKIEKGNYLISIGRSNRDFDFLKNSLRKFDRKTFVFSDIINKHIDGNVEFTGSVHGANEAMVKSFCVIVPIKDATISAGQTLVINAMSYGKPIIVTQSKGLTDDYIINDFNGIIISKDEIELKNALLKLEDASFYDKISNNEISTFQQKYSIYAMGKNMSKILDKGANLL